MLETIPILTVAYIINVETRLDQIGALDGEASGYPDALYKENHDETQLQPADEGRPASGAQSEGNCKPSTVMYIYCWSCLLVLFKVPYLAHSLMLPKNFTLHHHKLTIQYILLYSA